MAFIFRQNVFNLVPVRELHPHYSSRIVFIKYIFTKISSERKSIQSGLLKGYLVHLLFQIIQSLFLGEVKSTDWRTTLYLIAIEYFFMPDYRSLLMNVRNSPLQLATFSIIEIHMGNTYIELQNVLFERILHDLFAVSSEYISTSS